MNPVDELFAPGREIEALLRSSLKGNHTAAHVLAERMPRVLDAEDRWLLNPLRNAGDAALVARIERHLEAHDRMRAVLEQLREPGMPDEQMRTLLRILDAMLAPHLRREQATLREACDAGLLDAGDCAPRFARKAGDARPRHRMAA